MKEHGVSRSLLTVIEEDLEKPRGKGKSIYWKCLCECGNEVSVLGPS